MDSKVDQCEECKWYKSHDVTCSRMPADEALRRLRAAVISLRETHDFNKKAFARLRESVTLWQGKFHILRHENNKLRKRWHHLTAISDPETLEAHQRILQWLGCDACKAAAEAEIKAVVEGKKIITK